MAGKTPIRSGLLALVTAAALTASQQAGAAEYFAGKRIRIVLPSKTLNTGYGLYGSLAANHLARFLPGNPEVVISFMPGATGLTLLNYLYNVAPKDGTVIGIVPQDIAIFQATKTKAVRFDADKFEYIVRIAPNVPVHMVRGDAKVKTVADLKVHETLTAAVGVVGTHNDMPRATNALAGTKWKIIGGYPGGAATRLAMESNEVQASISPAALFATQLKDWLTSGKVRVIVQYADFRHPLFPGVPAVVELASAQNDKAVLTFLTSVATIGRGFFGPPAMAAEAKAIYTRAFSAMLADPAYLAEAKKRGAETIPMPGDKLRDYIRMVSNTPAEIVKKAADITRASQ